MLQSLGLDPAIEHDQLTGLGINSGTHKPRGASDDRIGRFGVNEIVELCFAFWVIAVIRITYLLLAAARSGLALTIAWLSIATKNQPFSQGGWSGCDFLIATFGLSY